MNVIQQENTKAGTQDWELTSPILPSDRESNTFRCREIEGYASLTSVNLNETIKFYVSTIDPQFSLTVFRLGWYAGLGGRQMTDQTTLNGKNQPTSQMGSDGLLECSWEVSHTLKIPPDWVSGVYVAKLIAQLTQKQSYIIFVVRDDERPSDYLFQSSVTTFQAYNNWGGKSIYNYNCDQNFNSKFFQNQSAKAVSFERPYAVPHWTDGAAGAGAGDFFTHDYDDDGSYDLMRHSATWEYNMVRWLEAEGYDVTYCTNIDTHANPDLLLSHRGFLSVGHDEYWSQEMFDNVTKARDRGINLAFFSANSVYWRVHMKPSIVTQRPNRSFYVDKTEETDLFQKLVPLEKSLVGASWDWGWNNSDIVITEEDHWVFQGTELREGDILPGLVGYEFNGVPEEGTLPPGLLSIAISNVKPYDMTVYQVASGATVFSANTIQWSWGLDDYYVPVPPNPPNLPDSRFTPRSPRKSTHAQQITRNVLNRFAQTNQGVLSIWGANVQSGFSPVIVKGERSTWHTIVPGNFSDNASTALLFYDATAGEIAFYSVDPAGKLIRIGEVKSKQRRTWSAIIPGNFTDSPYTDLLFYDAIAGEMALYATNGKGKIIKLATGMIGCRQTWHSIIPGNFSNSAYTDLLFYDADNGESAFYSTDGKGALNLFGPKKNESQIWYLREQRKTWHSIVAGNFSSSPYTDLLFYDANAADAEFYSTDGNGNLTKFLEIPKGNWRRTWSAIASGNFSNSFYSDLLFYEGYTGDLKAFSTDGQGDFPEITTSLQSIETKPWQSIVLLDQFNSASPLSSVLVYDRHGDKG